VIKYPAGPAAFRLRAQRRQSMYSSRTSAPADRFDSVRAPILGSDCASPYAPAARITSVVPRKLLAGRRSERLSTLDSRASVPSSASSSPNFFPRLVDNYREALAWRQNVEQFVEALGRPASSARVQSGRELQHYQPAQLVEVELGLGQERGSHVFQRPAPDRATIVVLPRRSRPPRSVRACWVWSVPIREAQRGLRYALRGCWYKASVRGCKTGSAGALRRKLTMIRNGVRPGSLLGGKSRWLTHPPPHGKQPSARTLPEQLPPPCSLNTGKLHSRCRPR